MADDGSSSSDSVKSVDSVAAEAGRKIAAARAGARKRPAASSSSSSSGSSSDEKEKIIKIDSTVKPRREIKFSIRPALRGHVGSFSI